jgi:hypothetical protein
MPKEQSPGKATTRRYTPDKRAAAVRMVRALRVELGTEHGRSSGSPASSARACYESDWWGLRRGVRAEVRPPR